MKSKSAKAYLKKILTKYSDHRGHHVSHDKDLIQLSKKSDVSGALAALKAGAKVNAVDAVTGRTALHFAVEKNCLPLVGILLRYKARSDIQDNSKNYTPLMLAATELNLQRAILAMMSTEVRGLDKLDHLGRNLINIALDSEKDLVAVFFAEKGVSLQQAFIWALEEKHIEQISWFLKRGCSVNTVMSNGFTPLMRAILEKNQVDVIYYLRNGANPNLIGGGGDLVSTHGKTPLMVAIETAGAEDIVLEILEAERTDLEVCDPHGETAIFKAVRTFNFSAVRSMIKRGANTKVVSREGLSLFHALVQSGKAQMAQFIWEMGGYDVSHPDKRGWSPLMYAAKEGFLPMVELLMTYGADPGYRSPHLGITAVDLAIGIRRKGPRELSVEKQIEFDRVISILSKSVSSSSSSF
ncbi:MAG: ankyrin repeat domain-containing protein [Bdellovibrionales bacterium]|nr:ankyrin repeat domain-containing protein [Bdellovibrionales bacterium]